MKVKALDHIHIYSSSPTDACQFYIAHLGATELIREKTDDGREKVVLDIAGQIIVLGHFPAHLRPATRIELDDNAYACGFGLAHFGVRVTSLNEVIAELQAYRLDYIEAPRRDGIKKQLFIKAPDDVFIEVSEY